jgi:poly(A) polymerase
VSPDQHLLKKKDIDPNAITVVERLTQAGYEAYVVGGAIRDLLMRQTPKDFDIATNATPQQIKKLFRQARIIGRRFKLVHIPFHRDIIEVSTFRSHEPIHTNLQTNAQGMLIEDNVYGTLEQDAWRRDFTANSLYYQVDNGTIINFAQGFQDIQHKRLCIIGEPNTRYHEDPVRMLRAVRFAAKLNFTIAPDTVTPILSLNHLLTQVSGSRLFDEMLKLYQNGNAYRVQQLLEEYGLFQQLFPLNNAVSKHYPMQAFLQLALESTDARVKSRKPVNPAFLFAVILWFPMQVRAKLLQRSGVDPIPALDQAYSQVISEQSKIITIPKRHSQVIRDIWYLQTQFAKRKNTKIYHLYQHPRFRAAYDFFVLRALAHDESLELAKWWTTFQEVDAAQQEKMITDVSNVKER